MRRPLSWKASSGCSLRSRSSERARRTADAGPVTSRLSSRDPFLRVDSLAGAQDRCALAREWHEAPRGLGCVPSVVCVLSVQYVRRARSDERDESMEPHAASDSRPRSPGEPRVMCLESDLPRTVEGLPKPCVGGSSPPGGARAPPGEVSWPTVPAAAPSAIPSGRAAASRGSLPPAGAGHVPRR